MNREKYFTPFSLYLLIMMFLMAGGCSTKDDTTYTISGTVTVYGSDGALANVTIGETGSAGNSTTTGSNGDFSFSAANGTYTLIPSLTNYTFNPVSTVVTVSGGNITDINFVATSTAGANTYDISGTVTGAVQDGVLITLSGTQTGTAATNTDGTYSFNNLVNGETYTVTPSLSGYTFKNTGTNAEDVTITAASVANVDFTATAE